jgi:hypothetical protein
LLPGFLTQLSQPGCYTLSHRSQKNRVGFDQPDAECQNEIMPKFFKIFACLGLVAVFLLVAAWPLLRWIDLALYAGIEDILFYGRVVDQYGKPMSNVTIHYEAPGKFYGSGSGLGSTISDGDGTFTIDVHGSSLRIRGMKHPEAMYVGLIGNSATARMYPTSNSFYSFRQTENSGELLWTETSPENPFVFDMWRVELDKAKSEDENISWDKKSIRIGHDGSPYTVKLNVVKRSLQVKPGIDDDGDLIVRCERESMQQHTDRSDWSVTIEPVKGGIQETKDRYLNLAPESGYQPSITVSKKLGEKYYQPSIIEKRYYFTAQNGRVYGTLFNDYRPFNLPNQPKSGDFIPQYCLITFEYKVNRSGSRYLFKDRSLLTK